MYTWTRLAQPSNLEIKATLLVCLSWDALCVPQAAGSMRGYPNISYIYLVNLYNTEKNKQKTFKMSKQKEYIYIYTLKLPTNLTLRNVELI